MFEGQQLEVVKVKVGYKGRDLGIESIIQHKLYLSQGPLWPLILAQTAEERAEDLREGEEQDSLDNADLRCFTRGLWLTFTVDSDSSPGAPTS